MPKDGCFGCAHWAIVPAFFPVRTNANMSFPTWICSQVLFYLGITGLFENTITTIPSGFYLCFLNHGFASKEWPCLGSKSTLFIHTPVYIHIIYHHTCITVLVGWIPELQTSPHHVRRLVNYIPYPPRYPMNPMIYPFLQGITNGAVPVVGGEEITIVKGDQICVQYRPCCM